MVAAIVFSALIVGAAARSLLFSIWVADGDTQGQLPTKPRQDEPPATGPVQVLLVDEHRLQRADLRQAFDQAGDIEVVGEVASIVEALGVLDRLTVDVLVTDVRLSDGDGLTLTTRARAANPTMGIVVLTMFSGDDHVLAAMDAGASAFIDKGASAEQLLTAVRHAAASPLTFTARNLAGALQQRTNDPAGRKLSPREQEVLALLVDGLAIAQIARRLHLGESRAKSHVAQIYQKLGARALPRDRPLGS